jgi:hypothetical protein
MSRSSKKSKRILLCLLGLHFVLNMEVAQSSETSLNVYQTEPMTLQKVLNIHSGYL